MREILFKAKRLDNSEWVTGDLTQDRDLDQCFISGWDYYTDYSGLQREPFEYQVDTGTVCQYTGLTDSNGVKVFDGDILKFTDKFSDYEWIGRMEFGNPNAGYTWGWQLVYVSGEEANVDTLCWFDMEENGAYSEVIGNIHDKED